MKDKEKGWKRVKGQLKDKNQKEEYNEEEKKCSST